MKEFTAELTARLREVRQQLSQAREDGDEYDVQVLSGRLDSLTRLATEHGVDPGDPGDPAAAEQGERPRSGAE